MKIRGRIRGYSLFWKIVAILILVMSVPIILYIISSTRESYARYERVQREDCASLVYQYSDSFKKNMDALGRVSRSFTGNPSFSYDKLAQKSISVFLASREMNTMISGVNVNRVGLYFGYGRLYTSAGQSQTLTFFKSVIGKVMFELTDAERALYDQFLLALDPMNPELRLFSLYGKNLYGVTSDRLFAMFTVPIVGSVNRVTVLYELVEENGLAGASNKALGVLGYGIADASGTLLYAGSPLLADALASGEGQALLHSSGGYADMRAGDEQVTVYLARNASLNLTFVLLTSAASSALSFGDMIAVLNRSMIGLYALFVALCVLAAYLSYMPIRKLVRRVRGIGVLRENEPLSEVQAIESTIQSLQLHTEEIQRVASYQRSAIAANALESLIDGRSVDDALLKRYGIYLSGPVFCVILLRAARMDSIRLNELAVHLASRGVRAYCADESRDGLCAFVANLSAPDERKRAALTLLEAARASGSDSRAFCGVGVTVSAEIYVSYLTARAAYENGRDGDEAVVLFDKAAQDAYPAGNLPSESLLKLIQYCKHGDLSPALGEMHGIVSELESDSHSEYAKQYAYISLANALESALGRQGARLNAEEIIRLVHASDARSLSGALEGVVERACASATESIDREKRAFEAELQAYVDDRVCDPSFSLAALSEHFSMPGYTMSRTFKRVYDIGFNEYLVGRRIGFAKEALILSPEKNVADVAREAGFNDVSYFNKVFKNICGMTPTQYRREG